MVTWRETRERLKQDRQRLSDLLSSQPSGRPLFLFTSPSYQCVWLYRVSHYFFRNGHRLLGRFFWHLNLLLTGGDINPFSEIGPGFVLVSPNCVTIVGKVGRNSTWHVQSGIGGGRSTRDVGAGPGLPLIGDDVEFGAGCMVVGPIRVGDRVKIGTRSTILFNVPDDAEVVGPASTVKTAREDYDPRTLATAEEMAQG